MNVTLNDSVSLANINTTQVPLNGGTYNSAGGTLNSAFNGDSTVDGTWTLALFDMSAGGGTAVLNSATLNVDEVPEPITWAAILFGSLFLTAGLVNRLRASKPASQG
jgi:hypothetical protein